MKLFYSDIDNNKSLDPLLCYYIPLQNGKRELLPGATLGQLAEQVPSIKKKFLYNAVYAKATLPDIINQSEAEQETELTCFELNSCWIENKGGGKYEKHYLPIEAQIAPINAIVCDDLNKDGTIDLLVAGNEYQTDVMTGRYDASYGLFLSGQQRKKFKAMASVVSGLATKGDIKCLQIIRGSNNHKLILFAVNNGKLSVFRGN